MRIDVVAIILAFAIACPESAFSSAPDSSTRPIVRTNPMTEPAKINRLAARASNAPSYSMRPVRRAVEKRPQHNAKENENRAGLLNRSDRKKPKRRLGNLFSRRPAKGSICGVNGIEGVRVDPVRSRVRGCGISEPVRIAAVDGVVLSPSATIDCPTAKALFLWVNKSVKPTVKRKGGGVKSLKVAAHYACRTRNNKKGARISEHGKGRAIDISAIGLNDGSSLTVLKDWRSRNRKIMRTIHAGACGPFGTVLGPKSDRYHQDHFHFDTARYRSGPYCR